MKRTREKKSAKLTKERVCVRCEEPKDRVKDYYPKHAVCKVCEREQNAWYRQRRINRKKSEAPVVYMPGDPIPGSYPFLGPDD